MIRKIWPQETLLKVYQNCWHPRTQWQKPFPQDTQSYQLVLYFGAPQLLKNPGHFDELRYHFPQAVILGCSTGGEIFQQEVNDDTLVLSSFCFENTQIRLEKIYMSKVTSDHEAGYFLGSALHTKDLKAIFVLSDGLQVNGTALVQGLTHAVPPSVIITGGLAGDADRFQETFVSANAFPQKGVVAALGFYGDAIRIGHGSVGGWDVFGPERLITRAENKTIYEFDNQPALALYKKYLAEEADSLPGSALLFPLSIFPQGRKDLAVVRTVLQVDEKEQSITFAATIPQGYIAQLMRGNFEHLTHGACQAAQLATQGHLEGPQAAIMISCIGRKLLMGQSIADEVESALSILGNHTAAVGFYSYGEISPHEVSGTCDLHNQTMTITTISEKVG
jgi:hypothetical protein